MMLGPARFRRPLGRESAAHSGTGTYQPVIVRCEWRRVAKPAGQSTGGQQGRSAPKEPVFARVTPSVQVNKITGAVEAIPFRDGSRSP
jgi:hypothetical protein